MISLEECINQGMLRKIPPSEAQALDQLEKAKTFLEEAKESLEIDNPNSAFVSAYAAIFGAAKAILSRDGYRERSHACVVRYIEANYSDKLGSETIRLFDQYRSRRHKVMYSAEFYPTTEEATNIVNFAKDFISGIGKIIA